MSDERDVADIAPEVDPAPDALREEKRAELMLGPLAALIRWFESHGVEALLEHSGHLVWGITRPEIKVKRSDSTPRAVPSLNDGWQKLYTFTRRSVDWSMSTEYYDFRSVDGRRDLLAMFDVEGDRQDEDAGGYTLRVFPSLGAFIEEERSLRRRSDRENREQQHDAAREEAAYSDWHAGSADQFIDPTSPAPHSVNFATLSPYVQHALKWRAFSEIVSAHDLPLVLHVQTGGRSGQIELFMLKALPDLGAEGGCEVFIPAFGGDLQVRQPDGEVATLGSASDLLRGEKHMRKIVKAVSERTGWLPRSEPRHTCSTLVIRLIADLLLTNIFDTLRCYPGWEPWEGVTAGWMDLFPEGRSLWHLDGVARMKAATRYWLLHRSDRPIWSDEEWHAEDGPAVVLDAERAEAIILPDGTRTNLMDANLEAGSSVVAARSLLERLLEEPYKVEERRLLRAR